MFPEQKVIIVESEVTMLILGLVVLVFMFMRYSDLKRIPWFKILTISFCLLIISFIATVVEGIFWEAYINLLEHFCGALSSIFVTVWFWKVFAKGKESR
jgi:hypothetical protein